MNRIQYKMDSNVGPLYLVASENGLQGMHFNKQRIRLVEKLGTAQPEEKVLRDASRQVEEYFAGKRKKFDISFDLSGTVFQKKVWKELFKIPFGKTVSYKYIAKMINNPKAVRAVGSANGKNPVCVIIPCHRVIAADGSIGGYAGGLGIKKKLLKHEAIELCA